MSTQATFPRRSEKERRRSQRKPHIVEAWVSSPTATDPLERDEVTGINVSRHGLAFESTEPMPASSFHLIDIAMGEQRMRGEIRIISCRRGPRGRWEIGAEFC